MAQVNITALAIGGVAIFGVGYLTSKFLFKSDGGTQVTITYSCLLNEKLLEKYGLEKKCFTSSNIVTWQIWFL
jgi:hypothetical protein